MKTYKTVKGLQSYLNKQRKAGKTIGFSPTMGALHAGHISLVKSSQSQNDINVVSIFVNPTQFDDKKDLDKYPRLLEEDSKLLRSVKLDVLFAPNLNEIYPKDYHFDPIDLKGLDRVMEGKFREGHFDGVVEVVKRLLDIVQPNKLYMGQKDFQQFTIIQYMIKHFKLKTKLVVVPIMREANGLAMSSRNRRLSRSQQDKSTILHKKLKEAKTLMDTKTPKQISDRMMRAFKKNDFKPEYFLIADGNTLESITDFKKHKYVVACTAVWAFGVRLIDNMILKK